MKQPSLTPPAMQIRTSSSLSWRKQGSLQVIVPVVQGHRAWEDQIGRRRRGSPVMSTQQWHKIWQSMSRRSGSAASRAVDRPPYPA